LRRYWFPSLFLFSPRRRRRLFCPRTRTELIFPSLLLRPWREVEYFSLSPFFFPPLQRGGIASSPRVGETLFSLTFFVPPEGAIFSPLCTAFRYYGPRASPQSLQASKRFFSRYKDWMRRCLFTSPSPPPPHSEDPFGRADSRGTLSPFSSRCRCRNTSSEESFLSPFSFFEEDATEGRPSLREGVCTRRRTLPLFLPLHLSLRGGGGRFFVFFSAVEATDEVFSSQ